MFLIITYVIHLSSRLSVLRSTSYTVQIVRDRVRVHTFLSSKTPVPASVYYRLPYDGITLLTMITLTWYCPQTKERYWVQSVHLTHCIVQMAIRNVQHGCSLESWNYSNFSTKMYSYCTADNCSQILQYLFHFVQLLSTIPESTVEATESIGNVLYCTASGRECDAQSFSKEV